MEFTVKDKNEDTVISVYTDYKELRVTAKLFDGFMFGLFEKNEPIL